MRSCEGERHGVGGRPAEAGLGRARSGASWPASARGTLLLRQPGAAWSARAPHGEEEEDEAPRRRYRARRSDPTTLIIVGGIAVVALITLVFIMLSIGAGKPTLAELKQRIGIPAEATTVRLDLPYVVFCKKAGIPSEIQRDASFCYLFYKVQEGTALIAVERAAWDNAEQARIREIRMVN
jgi:hypothetical protein